MHTALFKLLVLCIDGREKTEKMIRKDAKVWGKKILKSRSGTVEKAIEGILTKFAERV